MSNEALYQERLNLIKKAIACEPVDRVPIAFLGPAFAPRYMGMSMARFIEDGEAAMHVTPDALDKLGGFDAINSAVVGRFSVILTTLWLSRIKVPGRDLPPDSLWQVDEAEVMTPEDYDFIAENGWGAFLNSYFPRVIDPAELGECLGWAMQNLARGLELFRDRGYVVIGSGASGIPFEAFCGGRSMARFFLDIYRMPDRVQAAMDRALPEMIAGLIGLVKASPGAIGTWVGGWRAASAMVAPKLWDRFVWPYYVKMVDALVAEGITPILHWDQDWTRDLERLKELPAKKVVLNPDGMTDVRKFRQIVGDRMALMGDVPASLFAAGTPDDVYNYVRDLIRDVGTTGLILCSGCDIPVNAKPENVKAMVAAGRDYGKVN